MMKSNTIEEARAFLNELSDAFPNMPFEQALVEYADQFKPKWISVEEGLPESYVNVLVYYDDDGLYRVDTMIHNGKKWIYQWTNKFTVTHWMPLPEPPKTEQ